LHSLGLGCRDFGFEIEFAQRGANLCFLRPESEYSFAPLGKDFNRDFFAPYAERFERIFDGGVDVIAFGFDEIHN
jgi:hypothetical protein